MSINNTSQQIARVVDDPLIAPALVLGNRPAVTRREIGSALGGAGLGVLGNTTGPLVALHEVVGHGLLGYQKLT